MSKSLTADALPGMSEEVAVPKLVRPGSSESRRSQSSGSKRCGTAPRDWFDVQPADWVERRRRCPRPQSAPVKRSPEMQRSIEDFRREPYPQRVRELLISRRAERERVGWIDRLADAYTKKLASKEPPMNVPKPERQDKFTRWQFEAERNIAKMEEELGKIAVRKKPQPKRTSNLLQFELFERLSRENSTTLTNNFKGFAKYGSDSFVHRNEVGLDPAHWLRTRLPDYDPEKDTANAASPAASPKKADRPRAGSDDNDKSAPEEDRPNNPAARPTKFGKSATATRARRPRTPTAPAPDDPSASAPLGRRPGGPSLQPSKTTQLEGDLGELKVQPLPQTSPEKSEDVAEDLRELLG